jgi:hypothetical protein
MFLARASACAIWVFAWPICAGMGGGTLPYPRIAVAMAQEGVAKGDATADDR